MVKHTQTIRRLLLTNCLGVFSHFVGLALTGLRNITEWREKVLNVKLLDKIRTEG